MGFTEREKEMALAMYRECADAVGQAVVRWERREWEAGVPEVYVALFSHAYGTDAAVFTSEREARSYLVDVAITQCTRDPRTRRAVTKALGRWPASDFNDLERDMLIDGWSTLARGEALWVSRCAVEREFSRRKLREHMEAECATTPDAIGAEGPSP